MQKVIDVSIVIPLYNEEENVMELYEELHTVMSAGKITYEILLINDGSSDSTGDLIADICKKDQNVTYINFRRNFGQTAAMAAGFEHANGKVVITMDGDLQNDPRDIFKLLDEIERGVDVVAGWRYDRKDAFLSRRLPSMIANKIISVTTGVHLHDYGCTLKAIRSEVTDEIKLYGEMHRFIPAIASGIGISISEVKVNHRPRIHGTSKYGITRTFRVILDLITVKFLLSYSNRPIHVFGLIGMMSGVVGFLLMAMLVLQRQLYDMPLGDRPLLLLAILFMFIGIQFVTIGLVSELQVRTYHESQNKPTYYIKSIFSKGKAE